MSTSRFTTVRSATTAQSTSTRPVKKSHIDGPADINAGTYIENAEIGPNVQIGPNCSVVGVTHELTPGGMVFGDDIFERIILHDGAFLGANAVVGPGVEIGEGSVVGAGATVTRDVGPGMLVRGTRPNQERVALREWVGD
ncbi:acyltransferase [Halovenus halobia]|uniref:acyltransferase n=1 Tax=Halovenus halobia TaxID=3396622 RepID=UPI003F56972D